MTLPPVSSFDKISPTARLVTYARQFSDIPYTVEIAQQVDAEALFVQFAARSQLTAMAALIEGRYKAIDALIAHHSHRQILELASGLLPRGMIMTQNPEITFVESDLPAMIVEKQQVVTQLVGDRANLHFRAIDATQPFPELPFQLDQPITVVCEGFLSYLDLNEKAQVFTQVRKLLDRSGGVWITTDPSAQRRLRLLKQAPELQNFLNTLAQITDRNQGDTAFKDFEHLKQFALQQGFQHIESHSMIAVMPQLKCFEQLEIDPEIAKILLETTPVFVLSV